MVILSPKERAEWLAMLAPPDVRGDIVVLKIAVDESGTHGDAAALCVAAVHGTRTQWDQFTKDWAPTAAKYERVGGFHTTKARGDDVQSLGRIYARWLHAFAVVLPYDDFQVVPHRLRSMHGAEYMTALRAIILAYKTYCDKRKIRWTTWVIEAGHKEQAAAERLFKWLVAVPEYHVYSYAFVGKNEIVTHAPDVVAHFGLLFAARRGLAALDDSLGKKTQYKVLDRDGLLTAVKKGEELVVKIKRLKAREKAKRRQTRARGDGPSR